VEGFKTRMAPCASSFVLYWSRIIQEQLKLEPWEWCCSNV